MCTWRRFAAHRRQRSPAADGWTVSPHRRRQSIKRPTPWTIQQGSTMDSSPRRCRSCRRRWPPTRRHRASAATVRPRSRRHRQPRRRGPHGGAEPRDSHRRSRKRTRPNSCRGCCCRRRRRCRRGQPVRHPHRPARTRTIQYRRCCRRWPTCGHPRRWSGSPARYRRPPTSSQRASASASSPRSAYERTASRWRRLDQTDRASAVMTGRRRRRWGDCPRRRPKSSWTTLQAVQHTDLHIYNLDTVPPTDVVWNDVATDKLTTQNGDTFRGSVFPSVQPLWYSTTTPHSAANIHP